MTKMAGGEFNRTEFNPEYEFNCGMFKRLVGKKTFFPMPERKSSRPQERFDEIGKYLSKILFQRNTAL